MRRGRIWIALTLPVLGGACEAPPQPAESPAALYEEAWEFHLREDPLFATQVGRHDWDDRLPAVAPADHERRARFWTGVVERLGAVDRERLTPDERLDLEIFEVQARDRVAEFEHRGHLIPITAETGFHTSFARLPERVPLSTVADHERYISRLNGFSRYVEEHVELMREGLAAGMVLPRVVLAGYESTIAPHLVDRPEASLFWAPFERFPASVPATDHEPLRAAGREAIERSVVPGYRSFLRFMTEEYIPGARATVGASELPGGREYYAWLVRHHTTLDTTAEEIHQVGLAEVERIRGEMEAIVREVGFDGELAGFLAHLRSDPRFFAATAEELLREAAWIAKRMDGRLPALFGTLPRLPYTVEPVPEDLAPRYTAGRYVGAPLGSTRPGAYWVNTYALDSRPLWALPALTLHEAVPGHHLQNALRQELSELPPFRRFSGVNAYGEGWALYSEWLGIEAGIYRTPYEHFGRLTYEMWRACRLVVDTGLHAFGWSRQRAIDYLAANTALSLHEVTTETDRYISWPGQALAYKVGELKLRELRRRAEERLLEGFDVRAFHDLVLAGGPVPLSVLEQRVDAWIEERATGG